MKKKFKLTNVDCANCAQKMEDSINKIPGVEKARVSFMMQKLTVEADEEKFDDIMTQATAICKAIEPDCSLIIH
ncbi:Heavy-metal-associated domain-containing protein [Granulicatella balaenopterae]|uniref:Heavy-metal-associated domain-containing protein n=1 Tax=Granulicatella balaenopterae TaxID=137733 RepID=A0A1H9PBS6_9LACT|nr:Heavy-metal-associated domain-containing protein [Granulicatella balaenopterae]